MFLLLLNIHERIYYWAGTIALHINGNSEQKGNKEFYETTIFMILRSNFGKTFFQNCQTGVRNWRELFDILKFARDHLI